MREPCVCRSFVVLIKKRGFNAGIENTSVDVTRRGKIIAVLARGGSEHGFKLNRVAIFQHAITLFAKCYQPRGQKVLPLCTLLEYNLLENRV